MEPYKALIILLIGKNDNLPTAHLDIEQALISFSCKRKATEVLHEMIYDGFIIEKTVDDWTGKWIYFLTNKAKKLNDIDLSIAVQPLRMSQVKGGLLDKLLDDWGR